MRILVEKINNVGKERPTTLVLGGRPFVGNQEHSINMLLWSDVELLMNLGLIYPKSQIALNRS
jgi:hypothetical protein